MRVRGRTLTLSVRCQASGTVKLTTANHAPLAARHFTCAGGRASVAVKLSRTLIHRSRTHQVTLLALVHEQGAGTTTVRVRLHGTSTSRAAARAASATTSTYCEYDSGSGLPLCYEYWLQTYGPKWYPAYGHWLWAGQASMWLSGEYQGTVWFWEYWNGSSWVYLGRT
jgi:hypothetical protein